MKYFCFQDIFMFSTLGVVEVDEKEIINIQPVALGEEGSNIFYWLTDDEGNKKVDVLFDGVVFDNREDAHAWALGDLPGFIKEVEDDIGEMDAARGEAMKVIEVAKERLVEVQAVLNPKANK